jgi:hypothetical protein
MASDYRSGENLHEDLNADQELSLKPRFSMGLYRVRISGSRISTGFSEGAAVGIELVQDGALPSIKGRRGRE